MRIGPGARRLTAAALLLALGWSLLLGLWHLEGRRSFLDPLEALTLDLRFLTAGPQPSPEGLVILAIDDATVQAAGRYPLPRALLARLLEAVAAQDPAVVALDLLFVESQPEADAALRLALESAPTVIGAAALFAPPGAGEIPRQVERSGPLARLPRPQGLLLPTEALREAAEVGLVNISADAGGTPRHLPLLFNRGGGEGLLPAFVLLAAALAADSQPRFAEGGLELGGRRIALDLGYHLALRFYGPRGSIATVSALELLRGGLPPDALRGRAVVIGATAIASGDTFATPFSPVVPGVEILATGIGNLIGGEALIRTQQTRWIDALAGGLFALLAVLLIDLRRSLLGLLSVAALAVGWTIFVFALFLQGYWFSLTLPLMTLLPVAALYGAARHWLDRRRVQQLSRVEQGLRPFHPPGLAARLAAEPAFLAAPRRQQAAVLFIDLSGFTGASEALGEARTRELLKSFHSLVDEAVSAEGGFVVSFMGDGAMALFGFPEQRPDDAARALRAALALRARAAAWARHEGRGPAGPLDARLGVHFGPVVISRLGGASHQHITATGDTVNVASRLLEIAKQRRAPLAIGDSLYTAAIAEAPALASGFTQPFAAPLRGRERPVIIRTWEGVKRQK